MISSKMIMEKQKSSLEKLIETTIPKCCNPNVPISAQLLLRQKNLKELDDELEKKREDFEVRVRKFEKRRNEIKRKENLLINSIKEFEQFIEERDLKKSAAELKYKHESKVIEEIESELNILKENSDYLQRTRETLQMRVNKFLPAKLFLEKVVNYSVQFEDVNEIITFYDTLVAINEELTENETKDLKLIDEERDKLATFKTINENKILALTNKLYGLQQDQEKTYNEALSAEAKYNDIQSSNNNAEMALGHLIMAISSMYMTICKYEGVHPYEQNTVQKLEKIHDFIEDWSEIVPEVKKKVKKNKMFEALKDL